MTDKSDHEDQRLSRLYREGAWPEPSRQIDEAILAAARRAARARREASLVWRWAPRFALAATVVLTSTLVLRMYQEQPEAVPPPVPAKRPARPAAPAPAPEAKIESVPAPKNQIQELAKSRDQSMQLRYQNSPTQPEAASAAKGFASEATRADRAQQLPQSPRARELAPAAPAPGTNVISGIAGGRTADALERSPQTWLEDIRRLKAQGRNEEAARELAEFRKRHPEYPLPEDLR